MEIHSIYRRPVKVLKLKGYPHNVFIENFSSVSRRPQEILCLSSSVTVCGFLSGILSNKALSQVS